MDFDAFPKPYDPRFNPLSMVRVGTEHEEADALELASHYVAPDAPEREIRLVQLAGIIRIVLRKNPNATLDAVAAIGQRLKLAWMRDVLGLSPN
jgi:hypothetical protein